MSKYKKCDFTTDPLDPSYHLCFNCGRSVYFKGDAKRLSARCGEWKPGRQLNLSQKVLPTEKTPGEKKGCGCGADLAKIKDLPEGEREAAIKIYRDQLAEKTKAKLEKMTPEQREKYEAMKADHEARYKAYLAARISK